MSIAPKADTDVPNFPVIKSQREFEKFYGEMAEAGTTIRKASFRGADSDYIDYASTSGDISGSHFDLSLFGNNSELQSFGIQTNDGEFIEYVFQSGSLDVRRVQEHLAKEKKSVEEKYDHLPEWQSVYFASVCTLYAMYLIDNFIDANGLRPVVTEIERRKWAILLGLYLFSIMK